jgi:uracil-DNA glycosylase
MTKLQNQFEEGWWLKLSPFLLSDKFKNIGAFLTKEVLNGKQITPSFDNTFRAFKECPYKDLKVVILGLDPYPGKNIADGLAFSARDNLTRPPKSLEYIINAVEKDVYGGFAIGYNEECYSPDLTRWAKQGVLLLNTALSTEVGKTGVHLELWQPFIQNVFSVLRNYNTGLIYILLGAKAKMWKAAINTDLNFVLEAVHPAYSAYKGLIEWDCNRIFLRTNEIITKNNGEKLKILW